MGWGTSPSLYTGVVSPPGCQAALRDCSPWLLRLSSSQTLGKIWTLPSPHPQFCREPPYSPVSYILSWCESRLRGDWPLPWGPAPCRSGLQAWVQTSCLSSCAPPTSQFSLQSGCKGLPETAFLRGKGNPSSISEGHGEGLQALRLCFLFLLLDQ